MSTANFLGEPDNIRDSAIHQRGQGGGRRTAIRRRIAVFKQPIQDVADQQSGFATAQQRGPNIDSRSLPPSLVQKLLEHFLRTDQFGARDSVRGAHVCGWFIGMGEHPPKADESELAVAS
ncbi:MAG: hypothetical protein JOZ81_28530 [Chloroflexi bacterium]|nr:hypothetical protein [Chloroflexota bacterium]